EAVLPLEHRIVAVIGTGKMARIAAKALRPRADIRVVNRNHPRARELAQSLDGEAVPWAGLQHLLADVDVVLAGPAVRSPALWKTAEAVRQHELEEAFARLPDLSDEDRAIVDKLSMRLVNRFLHGPTERLRSLPGEKRAEVVQEMVAGLRGGHE